MSSEGESLSGQRLFKDHIAEISSDNPYIPTSCPGGFQKQSSALIQKQTPAYSVVRHDWNFKQDLLLRSDETKRAFWQQTPYVFGANRDKKITPCPLLNITLDLSCCGPIFLLENLIMGHSSVLHQDNDLKQTSNTRKLCH